MASLGERLRVAREARGLSLSEVSEQIRIRTIYLVALEEENWRAIGAPVYVRGFLRTYARFLGLDPEEVVAQFGEAVPSEPATEPHYVVERSPRRSSTITWIAACVAVLLVAFVAYNALTMHRSDVSATGASATTTPVAVASQSPGARQAIAMPPPAIPHTPTPGPGGHQSIALVLSAPSWLRVVVDGNVSMEGTFPAGTSKTFHGRAASVRLGNAGGVEIYVDGKNVGKLGKSGDVVDRAFVL
ncbi:MAG TPA: RodZ domain-containing protein [Candidatus Tumulicola sp.]|jgi:transcriptional regulator with XRE-family HTH domain